MTSLTLQLMMKWKAVLNLSRYPALMLDLMYQMREDLTISKVLFKQLKLRLEIQIKTMFNINLKVSMILSIQKK